MSRQKATLENWVLNNWATLVGKIPKVNKLVIGVNGDREAHMCLRYLVDGCVWVFDPNGALDIIPVSAYDRTENRKLLEFSMTADWSKSVSLTRLCPVDPHTRVQQLTKLKGGVCFLICLAVHNYIKAFLKNTIRRGQRDLQLGVMEGLRDAFRTPGTTREFLIAGMPKGYQARIAELI